MLAALELSRPAVLVSLHNGELHGMHGYLHGDAPGLADRLAELPARFGFPREEVPVDAAGAQVFAPGVFAYPDQTAAWDAVLDSGHPDPASLLPLGDSVAAWAQRRYGTVTVLVEVPHWSIAGELPVSGTFAELLTGTAARIEACTAGVRDVLGAVALSTADARVRSCHDAVAMMTRMTAGFRAQADTPGAGRPATSEDVGRIGVMLGECMPQRYRGQLLAALTDALSRGVGLNVAGSPGRHPCFRCQ